MLLRSQWRITLIVLVWAQVSCCQQDAAALMRRLDLLENKLTKHLEKMLMPLHERFNIMEDHLKEIKQDMFEKLKELKSNTDNSQDGHKWKQQYSEYLGHNGDLICGTQTCRPGQETTGESVTGTPMVQPTMPATTSTTTPQSTTPIDMSGLPLWEAAKRGDLDGVKKALDLGVDVNWQIHDYPDFKQTALHAASDNNHTDVIWALLAAGADKDLQAAYNKTPIHLASINGNVDIVNILIAQGADVDIPIYYNRPLHSAAHFNHTEVVRALLVAGADIDMQNDRGETPLYEAGNAEVVKILIAHGANINLQSNWGATPLMMHTVNGDINAVKALLDANADVTIQETGEDTEQDTALHFAGGGNNLAIVKLLLQAGADPRKLNGVGNTAADEARINEADEVADFLERFSNSQGNLG